jgi:hypothetical protein
MSAVSTLLKTALPTETGAVVPVARVQPAALLAIVRDVVSVGGTVWIRVTGKSMNPIIRHGDRVLIGGVRGALRCGAVVLLDAGGSPLLHRVVAYRPEGIITRGDSRITEDPPQPLSSILGEALIVERGASSVCLVPTLAFGVAPLVRGLAWRARMRVPSAWAQLRRVRAYVR